MMDGWHSVITKWGERFDGQGVMAGLAYATNAVEDQAVVVGQSSHLYTASYAGKVGMLQKFCSKRPLVCIMVSFLACHRLGSKQTPTTSLRSTSRGFTTRRGRFGLPLELSQTFDLLQDELEHFFPPDDIEVFSDLRIFPGESFDLAGTEMSAQSCVELAREVVVKFGQQLHVQEEDRGGGEFVGHHVEEHLGAVVFVLESCALPGFDRCKTHPQDISPVSEENGLPT